MVPVPDEDHPLQSNESSHGFSSLLSGHTPACHFPRSLKSVREEEKLLKTSHSPALKDTKICGYFVSPPCLAWSVVQPFRFFFEFLSNFEWYFVISKRRQCCDCERVSILLNHFLGLQQWRNLAGCKINTCHFKMRGEFGYVTLITLYG